MTDQLVGLHRLDRYDPLATAVHNGDIVWISVASYGRDAWGADALGRYHDTLTPQVVSVTMPHAESFPIGCDYTSAVTVLDADMRVVWRGDYLADNPYNVADFLSGWLEDE